MKAFLNLKNPIFLQKWPPRSQRLKKMAAENFFIWILAKSFGKKKNFWPFDLHKGHEVQRAQKFA